MWKWCERPMAFTLVYRESIKDPQQLIGHNSGGKKQGEIGQPQTSIVQPQLSSDGRYVAVEGIEEAEPISGFRISIAGNPAPTPDTVLRDEDPVSFQVLLAELEDEPRPEIPIEWGLVRHIADAEWPLRRKHVQRFNFRRLRLRAGFMQ